MFAVSGVYIYMVPCGCARKARPVPGAGLDRRRPVLSDVKLSAGRWACASKHAALTVLDISIVAHPFGPFAPFPSRARESRAHTIRSTRKCVGTAIFLRGCSSLSVE